MTEIRVNEKGTLPGCSESTSEKPVIQPSEGGVIGNCSLTFVSMSLEGISGAPFSFACKLNFGEAQALPERGPSHRCAPLRIVGG